MKKGLRKLILSGTALAAVAATLGTSTYAWYTANDTVNATGITGKSEAAGASSIFISRDKKKWSQSVEMQSIDFTGADLVPVEFYNKGDNPDYNFHLLGTESRQARPEVKYTQDEINAAKDAVTDAGYTKAGSIDAFAPGTTYYTRGGNAGSVAYEPAGSFVDGTTYYVQKANSADAIAAAKTANPAWDKTTSSVKTEATTQIYSQGGVQSDASGSCISFKLYFRSSKMDTAANGFAYPELFLKSITVKNHAPSLDNVLTESFVQGAEASGAVGGVDVNQAVYAVDIVDALAFTANVKYSASTPNFGDVTADNTAKVYNDNHYAFDLKNQAESLGTEFVNVVEYTDANATDATNAQNALGYYNHVMDKTLNTSNSKQTLYEINGEDANTAINFGKLPVDGTHYMEIEFKIFLNGWDEYCYDACKGQTFDIDLSFTSTAASAMKIKTA